MPTAASWESTEVLCARIKGGANGGDLGGKLISDHAACFLPYESQQGAGKWQDSRGAFTMDAL